MNLDHDSFWFPMENLKFVMIHTVILDLKDVSTSLVFDLAFCYFWVCSIGWHASYARSNGSAIDPTNKAEASPHKIMALSFVGLKHQNSTSTCDKH